MKNSWEKGVVVGKDDRRYLVSSSYDTLVMYREAFGEHQLGECLEFIGVRISEYQQELPYERKVSEVRNRPKFVRTEPGLDEKDCMLVCDIVRVRVVYHEESDSMVRLLRTDFLEEVLDTSTQRYTYSYSDEELLRMEVVCRRVVSMKTDRETWVVYRLKQKWNGNNEMADIFDDEEDSKTVIDMKEGRSSERDLLHGFVTTPGTTKNGKDELYIWVPFTRRDLYFPLGLRRHEKRESFIGRWLSFSINQRGVLDELSDIRIADRDYLPTRRRANRYEIFAPCSFESGSVYAAGVLLLKSEMCGNIVDANRVLEKYGRATRSFTEHAWVVNWLYDFDVKFVLSDLQEEWDKEQLPAGMDRDWNRYDPPNSKKNQPVGFERSPKIEDLARQNSYSSYRYEDRWESTSYGNEISESDGGKLRINVEERQDFDDSRRIERSFDESEMNESVMDSTFEQHAKHRIPAFDDKNGNDVENDDDENGSSASRKLIEPVRRCSYDVVPSTSRSNFKTMDLEMIKEEKFRIKERKEQKMIELLEDLDDYHHVLKLMKEMMFSERVCEEMRRHNFRNAQKVLEALNKI